MEGEDHEEAGAAGQNHVRRYAFSGSLETLGTETITCQAQNGRRSSHDDNYSPLDLLPSNCPAGCSALLPSAAAAAAAAAGKLFSGPGNMTRLRLGPPLVKMALAVLAAVLASMAPRGRCDDAARSVVARSIFVNRKGGADFTSVQDAVDSVPLGNDQWIRVHVAAGVYNEKVMIPQNKSFILLEGEGWQQTSIEWADHAGGDSSTAATPTFAAYSADFMARDIAFKNTYNNGAGGMTTTIAPAVAALVAGDRSSFYRCGFVSVQDTLSDIQGRHYYEGCHIQGAMDFIFGNGQSIFQGCEIWTARTPVWPGFITAQGRVSEADTSGFVFKGCTVRGVTPAYLGRAWRRYARVIFYQTDMSGVVVSQGWDAWGYKGTEGTLTMVEEGCTGQGANRTGRVPWTKDLSGAELAKFVDLSYVSADGWLDAQPR